MADTPITVTSTALTFRVPDTNNVIDTGVNVTRAQLQPSPQAALFPRNVAVTSLALSPAAKAVTLTWVQSGSNWVIDVGTASISPFLYSVEGRRGIPVVKASPSLSPGIIGLVYSGLAVDRAVPVLTGQSLGLEKNALFTRAGISPLGKTIDLRLKLTVTSASLSPSGQSVTLTLPAGNAIFVNQAAPTISPQTITLNKSWSIPVSHAVPVIAGKNINFQLAIENGISVDPAQISPTPANLGFVLQIKMPVDSTALSMSPKTVGLKYDWYVEVEATALELFFPEIDLSFPFTLGFEVESASPSISGKEITLFLGDGQPRKVKYDFSSDHIQIALRKPEMVRGFGSERMTSATS